MFLHHRSPKFPQDDDKIPDVPPSEVAQGVLPRLIAELVNRRKRVKALMKDPKSVPAQRLQVRLLITSKDIF